MSLYQICWAGLVPFGGLGLGFAAGIFGVEVSLLGAAAICGLSGTAMAVHAGRYAA
mgnify:CR=1 FL=1